MKICLSSRPEPLIQGRLAAYPLLRLQDLNEGDLELYARDHTKFPDTYASEREKSLIRSLVDKAEGVFLWLVLAIKSVNKGVEYGDSTATFQERTERLPGDLISLYKDMWTRACEDDPLIYRKTAALYFKLLMMHRKGKFLFSIFSPSFGLFFFMLAATSTADQILQAGDDVPKLFSEEALLQRCRDAERQVDLFCFGLIEPGPGSSCATDKVEAIGLYGHKYDRLIPFARGDRVLRFIHRTAEGKEILDFNTSTEVHLESRIIKAYLAGSQLFIHGDYSMNFSTSFAAVPLLFISNLRVDQDIDDQVAEERIRSIHHCETLCNSGKLFTGTIDRARLCKGDDFLKVMANICGDACILAATKDGELSNDTKSEILLNAPNL